MQFPIRPVSVALAAAVAAGVPVMAASRHERAPDCPAPPIAPVPSLAPIAPEPPAPPVPAMGIAPPAVPAPPVSPQPSEDAAWSKAAGIDGEEISRVIADSRREALEAIRGAREEVAREPNMPREIRAKVLAELDDAVRRVERDFRRDLRRD